MTPQQEQRLAQIKAKSPLYLSVTQKAYLGKSRAAAIKAKCLDCTCWQRIEITHCTTTACPLHAFRPYQTESEGDE